MSAAPRVDWSKVEPHYRAGLRSLPDLADEFGISHTAIAKHAKKNGWDRDLKARIKAKADAKVSAAMVAAEVSPETKATEEMRVEVEAEVQSRIRLTHRKDIGRFRVHAMHLLGELDLQGDEVNLLTRTKVLKDLTDVTKTLVTLEREAFGLDGAPPPPPPGDSADPVDTARRLAFLLSAGMHAQPRMTQ